MAKNIDPKLSADVEAVLAEAEQITGFKSEKTVPAQASEVNDASVPEGGNESGYTKDEDLSAEQQNCDQSEPKKSFGTRLKSLTEKMKANKKGLVITLAVVGAATVAVAKFAAKSVVEEVVDSSEEKFEEAYSDKGDETPKDDTSTDA